MAIKPFISEINNRIILVRRGLIIPPTTLGSFTVAIPVKKNIGRRIIKTFVAIIPEIPLTPP